MFEAIASAIGSVFNFADEAFISNDEEAQYANDAAYITVQQTEAEAALLNAQNASENIQFILIGIVVIVLIIISFLIIKKILK